MLHAISYTMYAGSDQEVRVHQGLARIYSISCYIQYPVYTLSHIYLGSDQEGRGHQGLARLRRLHAAAGHIMCLSVSVSVSVSVPVPVFVSVSVPVPVYVSVSVS